MYAFTLVVHPNLVGAVQQELRELSEDVRCSSPTATTVMITGPLGLSLAAQDGECLDLTALSFSLYERLIAFFGFGCYALVTPESPGSRVQSYRV